MFQQNTRMRQIPLGTRTKVVGTSGGSVSFDLPRVGLLAGIFLSLKGSVVGAAGASVTGSAQGVFGNAGLIKRVRMIANAGIDALNVSGQGYHYLLREHLEDFKDPVAFSNARSALVANATTACDVSMFLPVALNMRDPIGLIMLQSDQILMNLAVEFASDAELGTGYTFSMNIKATAIIFDVPARLDDIPPTNIVHQIIEERQSFDAAGTRTMTWPRGNTIVGIYHMVRAGFTTARLRVNKSAVYYERDNDIEQLAFGLTHGRDLPAAPPGASSTEYVMWDFLGTDGLGSYGSIRDALDSTKVSDIETEVDVAGAGEVLTVRRQLVALA